MIKARWRVKRKKTGAQGTKKPREARLTGNKIPGLLEGVLRWGVIIIIVSLLITNFNTGETSRSEADGLAQDLTILQRERAELQSELDRFSDPEWRESYWKWRTMRHEPGEYYIDFVEPGII